MLTETDMYYLLKAQKDTKVIIYILKAHNEGI